MSWFFPHFFLEKKPWCFILNKLQNYAIPVKYHVNHSATHKKLDLRSNTREWGRIGNNPTILGPGDYDGTFDNKFGGNDKLGGRYQRMLERQL